MRIEIVLYPGFDELDAIGPLEVLQNARRFGADLDVRLAGFYGTGEVTASHGTGFVVEEKMADGLRPDLVIIPGGGWNNRSAPGAWAEAQSGEIAKAIRAQHQSGAIVASVCTGAMLIAAAGLLKGRPAITHHDAIEDLRASGARIVRRRVVDDGDVITAGGVTSGIDLGLWLTERFAGKQIADKVEELLEYQRQA